MFNRGSSQNPSVEDRMLPVFVFPNSLTFYADDKSQHKQVLTVYNPYDFGVRFKVLCTAPEKYVMADSEGVIRPLCCIDLVIRHNAITQTAIGITDNFRISMYEHGQKQLLGKKDIPVTLLKTTPRECGGAGTSEQENFQPLIPTKASHLRSGEQYSIASPRQDKAYDSMPSTSNSVIVLLGAICIVILMLPYQNDSDSSHWAYFQPSINMKLIAAFFLGMLITVFIKS